MRRDRRGVRAGRARFEAEVRLPPPRCLIGVRTTPEHALAARLDALLASRSPPFTPTSFGGGRSHEVALDLVWSPARGCTRSRVGPGALEAQGAALGQLEGVREA